MGEIRVVEGILVSHVSLKSLKRVETAAGLIWVGGCQGP